MTNYRVIIGEMILRDKDTGDLLNDGKIFPISHSNIIVDGDNEVAKYLVKQLGIERFELLEMEYPPMYLKHELN